MRTAYTSRSTLFPTALTTNRYKLSKSLSPDLRLFLLLRLPSRPAHLQRPRDISAGALARSYHRSEGNGTQIDPLFEGLEVVCWHPPRLRGAPSLHRAPLPPFRAFKHGHDGRGYGMGRPLRHGKEGAFESFCEAKYGLTNYPCSNDRQWQGVEGRRTIR